MILFSSSLYLLLLSCVLVYGARRDGSTPTPPTTVQREKVVVKQMRIAKQKLAPVIQYAPAIAGFLQRPGEVIKTEAMKIVHTQVITPGIQAGTVFINESTGVNLQPIADFGKVVQGVAQLGNVRGLATSAAMKAGNSVLDVALKSDNHNRRSELESRDDSTKKRPPPIIKPKQ